MPASGPCSSANISMSPAGSKLRSGVRWAPHSTPTAGPSARRRDVQSTRSGRLTSHQQVCRVLAQPRLHDIGPQQLQHRLGKRQEEGLGTRGRMCDGACTPPPTVRKRSSDAKHTRPQQHGQGTVAAPTSKDSLLRPLPSRRRPTVVSLPKPRSAMRSGCRAVMRCTALRRRWPTTRTCSQSLGWMLSAKTRKGEVGRGGSEAGDLASGSTRRGR